MIRHPSGDKGNYQAISPVNNNSMAQDHQHSDSDLGTGMKKEKPMSMAASLRQFFMNKQNQQKSSGFGMPIPKSMLIGVSLLALLGCIALLSFVNSDSSLVRSDADADLNAYPKFQKVIVEDNGGDEEEETDDEGDGESVSLGTEEFLSSPEELLISIKEEQLKEEVEEEMKEKQYNANINEMEDEEKPNELVEISPMPKDSVTSEGRITELGNLLFSDAEEYYKSEPVHLARPLAAKEYKTSGLWHLQELHDNYFLQNELGQNRRRHIPHLAQPISKIQFHEIFRQTSTPVVIPFDMLRNHGFLTRSYTIDELRVRFPFEAPRDGSVPLVYDTKSGKKDGLDLGPALYALQQDMELQKAKGFKRNFPRNLMLKTKYLAMLEISHPPFVPKKRFQPPTLWFGTSTADTRLHSDCCDNFVQMIAGTKRWYIAPPTDSKVLGPIKCDGIHQSLCWADIPYPSGPMSRQMTNSEKKRLGKSNGFVIDLHAGEMLYLPAGWWHHIENLGPTIMVNFWTYGCENVALALDLEPTRPDRPDFKKCPAVAQADASFLLNK